MCGLSELMFCFCLDALKECRLTLLSWTDGRAISALAEAVNPTGYIDLEKQLSVL